jgi:glycosidase
MSAAPWWKHPLIYQAAPSAFGGLHSLAGHLDYVHSLGIDALLLTSLSEDAKQTIDPALGTMDDFDEIVRRASEYNIRVLVDLDAHTADLTSAVRLWLAHGVAGFYVPGASPAQIADIRKSLGGFAGQRIVIGELAVSQEQPASGADAPQLVADGRAGTQEKLSASAIRPALEAAQQLVDQGHSIPLLFSDGPASKRSMSRYSDGTHDVEIARTGAAMLLTTRAAAMLYYGQELGLTDASKDISFDQPKKGEQPAPMSVAAGDASPASLLNWYRQLSALTHSNRTISTGAMVTLNHDDQNVLAWVRRPQAVSLSSPAIVVIENLSAQPVTLSLKADMQRLHLKGSFLRTLMRSDSAMGGMHLDGMTLPPFGVFIGELRY